MKAKIKNKSMTMWILLAIALVVLTYDAWACSHKKNTVSKIVTLSGKKYLLIPFLSGLLMGHFFWSQHLNALDE